MEIVLNDQILVTSSRTVLELIQELELQHQPVVIEIDGRIIFQEFWFETELQPGMKIELVQFVGGG